MCRRCAGLSGHLNHRTKELAVLDHVVDHFAGQEIVVVSNRTLEGGNSKRRPDIVLHRQEDLSSDDDDDGDEDMKIDKDENETEKANTPKDHSLRRRPETVPKILVIIETDENRHRDRSTPCECSRMLELVSDVGAGTRLVFVRFNPDAYTRASGERVPSCWKTSMQTGLENIAPAYSGAWQGRLAALSKVTDTLLSSRFELSSIDSHLTPIEKEHVDVQHFDDHSVVFLFYGQNTT